MKRLILSLLFSLSFVLLAGQALHAAKTIPDGRYLYMSTPDGAQRAGSADPGILVFSDADEQL